MSVAINATNFPDENFRSYVQKTVMGSSSATTLTDAKIQSRTSIDVTNKKIANLKGIEHFTALTILDCAQNQLTTLDVSKNTALTSLGCGANQLTTLDVSKNTKLTILHCGDNQLRTLDVSKNTALTILNCSLNQLRTLDISKNIALTSLSCGKNQLTTLDVSKNTALTILDCYSNQLTTLDVSKNTKLVLLNCSGNRLTTLDVSKNTALKNFDCKSNKLKTLDISKNTKLVTMYCTNQISSDYITVTETDNSSYRYQVDLSGHVGAANIGKIASVNAWNQSGNDISTNAVLANGMVKLRIAPAKLTYYYTVGVVGDETKTLDVTLYTSLFINSGTPSMGTVGRAYNHLLSAVGIKPITWSLHSGELPSGLSLSSTGQINGTPTADGTFTFTVKAANSTGSATKQLSLTVAAPTPSITTTSLSGATAGTAYSATLTASGSTPITWSLASGKLPPGMSLSSDGKITGTVPSVRGTYNAEVSVETNWGRDTKTVQIVVG